MEKLKTSFLPFVASALILACNNNTSQSQGEDTVADMPEKLGKAFIHNDRYVIIVSGNDDLNTLWNGIAGLPLKDLK